MPLLNNLFFRALSLVKTAAPSFSASSSMARSAGQLSMPTIVHRSARPRATLAAVLSRPLSAPSAKERSSPFTWAGTSHSTYPRRNSSPKMSTPNCSAVIKALVSIITFTLSASICCIFYLQSIMEPTPMSRHLAPMRLLTATRSPFSAQTGLFS
ncbi:MAG: hypothetical protein A4E43_00691 [Methanosaeta sp. PtaB.Bin005]|nr:MAG: hypothetical protein A4E43_00691 [Methanosaeta sp. PtaB.Bin005]